jgi:hypothetical protein
MHTRGSFSPPLEELLVSHRGQNRKLHRCTNNRKPTLTVIPRHCFHCLKSQRTTSNQIMGPGLQAELATPPVLLCGINQALDDPLTQGKIHAKHARKIQTFDLMRYSFHAYY